MGGMMTLKNRRRAGSAAKACNAVHCVADLEGAGLTRRQFFSGAGRRILAGAAVLSGRIGLPRSLAAEAQKPERNLVGSQLYGWGQYYARAHKNLNDHLDEVFAAIRDCGYDYAGGSLDIAHPENNSAFAERLRAKGLRPVTLYTGARLHEAGKSEDVVHQLLEVAKVCHRAGFRILNCNPEPIGREKTDAELSVQAASLEKLGAGLDAIGMRLGIHNHLPAMRDHAREFHYNFDHTDPGKVGFCFDVHWVYRGGLAPMTALREYYNRVACWHIRQSRHGIWWQDLDSGDVDYKKIAQFAKAHRMTAPYTVELAIEKGTRITRSVVENHRLSREYIRRMFGA